MSVLSRHRTIPSQKTAGEDVTRKAAPTQPSDEAPTTGRSRLAFLVSGAVLVAAAAVGGTSYVVAQNDSLSPAAVVELSYDSEAKRDRATAARGGTAAAAADTEAKRDAAAAARHASRYDSEVKRDLATAARSGTAAAAADTEAKRDAAAAARNASR